MRCDEMRPQQQRCRWRFARVIRKTSAPPGHQRRPGGQMECRSLRPRRVPADCYRSRSNGAVAVPSELGGIGWRILRDMYVDRRGEDSCFEADTLAHPERDSSTHREPRRFDGLVKVHRLHEAIRIRARRGDARYVDRYAGHKLQVSLRLHRSR